MITVHTDHPEDNWAGRLELRREGGHVDMGTRSQHDCRGMAIRSKEQAERIIAAIREACAHLPESVPEPEKPERRRMSDAELERLLR